MRTLGSENLSGMFLIMFDHLGTHKKFLQLDIAKIITSQDETISIFARVLAVSNMVETRKL